MLVESLLLANFLLLMAVVLEAKVRSKTGFFIVSTCFIISIMNLIVAVFQFII